MFRFAKHWLHFSTRSKILTGLDIFQKMHVNEACNITFFTYDVLNLLVLYYCQDFHLFLFLLLVC